VLLRTEGATVIKQRKMDTNGSMDGNVKDRPCVD